MQSHLLLTAFVLVATAGCAAAQDRLSSPSGDPLRVRIDSAPITIDANGRSAGPIRVDYVIERLPKDAGRAELQLLRDKTVIARREVPLQIGSGEAEFAPGLPIEVPDSRIDLFMSSRLESTPVR